MTAHDPTDQWYNARAFYTCLECDAGWDVEYSKVSDPQSFGATIQRYADGCPRCRSLNTRLMTLIANPVQPS